MDCMTETGLCLNTLNTNIKVKLIERKAPIMDSIQQKLDTCSKKILISSFLNETIDRIDFSNIKNYFFKKSCN